MGALGVVGHGRRGALGWLMLASAALTIPGGIAAKPAARPAPAVRVIEVTHDYTRRWGEHGIAINPRNPLNIVIATVGTGFTYACQKAQSDCQMVNAQFVKGFNQPQARGIFDNPNFNVVSAFRTMDGGKTWSRTDVPATPVGHPDINALGDPFVAATGDGTFYISFDDNNWGTPEKPLPNAGMGVVKSTDGGKSWTRPVLTGTPVDGPKITADTSTNTVYAGSSTVLGPRSTGDPTTPTQSHLDRWVASSHDGIHWTHPRPMGGSGGYFSAARGVLATAFTTSGQSNLFGSANNELCGDKPKPCLVFQTTADSGATWLRHIIATDDFAGSFGFPVVAADPSTPGHFAVGVLDRSETAVHVFATRDSGRTWTAPATVTDDPARKKFHLSMAFSPQGTLGLSWRSRTPVPNAPPPENPFMGPSTPYSFWAAISRDGERTFSAALELSTADSPAPQAGPFANGGDDYSSVVLFGDRLYAGWADWRPKERANMLAIVPLSAFRFGR